MKIPRTGGPSDPGKPAKPDLPWGPYREEEEHNTGQEVTTTLFLTSPSPAHLLSGTGLELLHLRKRHTGTP